MVCPPRQGHAGGTRHGAFENIPADDPIRSTFTIYKKNTALPERQGGVRKGNEWDEEQGRYGRDMSPRCLLPCSASTPYAGM